MLQQIIDTIKIRRFPIHDNINFRPRITRTDNILPLSVVTADKVMTVKENHLLVGELLQGFSIIPARYEDVPIWKTFGMAEVQKIEHSILPYKMQTIVMI